MRRVLALSVLASALVVASPASTSAANLSGCGERALSNPFLPWLDPAAYTLVPTGTLETTTGWSLSGGAKLVAGNEPFFVNSASDSRSLSLPSGSSATSPPMCVSLVDPTLRFFAVNGGSPLSELVVDVLYKDTAGKQRALTVALVTNLGTWAPTLPVAFLENVTGVLSLDGLTTEVRFRFRPTNGLFWSGKWRIDDVYVDPMKLW